MSNITSCISVFSYSDTSKSQILSQECCGVLSLPIQSASLPTYSTTSCKNALTSRDLNPFLRNLNITSRDVNSSSRNLNPSLRNLSSSSRDVSLTSRDVSLIVVEDGLMQ